MQLSEAGVLSVSLKMDKIEYRAVIKYKILCKRRFNVLKWFDMDAQAV